jgi:uncharacterized protein (DUF1501 family)
MPASAFRDKKFLVVMIKDGGEDSYGTLISHRIGHVAQVLAVRPKLAFSQPELSRTYAASKLAGSTFSLHPALQSLHSLWEAGDMAITHRVGPMFTNIANVPINELRRAASAPYNGNVRFPYGIGAHDKQAFATSSMITREFDDVSGMRQDFPGQGFIGRLATRFDGFTGSAHLPMSILCGGPALASAFLATDGETQPLTLPVVGGSFRRDRAGGATQASALRRLDAIMAEARSETRTEAFRQANLIATQSVNFLQPVIEGMSGSYAVDQDFPGNPTIGWQGIMRTFARAIEADARQPFLRTRTVFVGGVSGYDTHVAQGKLTGRLATLHSDWAASLASFRAAMLRLGEWNHTLVLDHSEFSRSLLENGSSGTDHAYARDAFAFGGMVRGFGRQGSSGLFGTYPAVLSAVGSGSFDLTGGEAAGGSLAPGISLEQYWDEPLRWFGADAADIAYVLPRRAAFGPSVDLVA